MTSNTLRGLASAALALAVLAALVGTAAPLAGEPDATASASPAPFPSPTPDPTPDPTPSPEPSPQPTPAPPPQPVPQPPFACPDANVLAMLSLPTRFMQAWLCHMSNQWWNGQGVPPAGSTFSLTEINGYGCYCGSGSTGLDTEPVDGYDACCRQHDIDWTAICRNVRDPNLPGAQGCNCYGNVPAPTGCDGGRLTFPGNLNACQEKCAEELNKQFGCYARYFNDSNYQTPDLNRHRNQCEWEHFPTPVEGVGNVGPLRPFDHVVPAYCRKSSQPIPGSDFGPVDAGPNVFKECTCFLNRADCSGGRYVLAACTKSADSCRAMGGVPGETCEVGQACDPNDMDVTAEPCPYRHPQQPCPDAAVR